MKAFEQPKFEIDTDQISETHTEFSMAPLEKGFGTTIGNSLRRVLLSSLPGLAIYAIQVEGAKHEYTPLQGVREDLTTIVLNIKNVVLKDISDDPNSNYKLTLDVQDKDPYGSGKEIKAGDINCPGQVSVVNKDLVLCHIENGAHLRIEFYCKKGRGFVTAEENKTAEMKVGIIPVDSNFSPIEKVKISVAPFRVGHDASYEKLLIEVDTNGSLSASSSIAFAAKVLDEHFKIFENLDEQVKNANIMSSTVESSAPSFVNMSLEDLDLSVRSYNCLKRSQIKTVADLCNMKESELMTVRNLGKKSYKEILEKLDSLGLKLQKDEKLSRAQRQALRAAAEEESEKEEEVEDLNDEEMDDSSFDNDDEKEEE